MSDRSDSAPASKGWLSAHALEAPAAPPFAGAAFARAAAEGLRSLAGKPGTGSGWDAFERPFREAAGHVDSIRNPLAASPALGKLGAVAGAALTGLAAPEEKIPGALADRALQGIGGAIGDAFRKNAALPDPVGATWVETGNPTVERASMRTAGAPARPAPARPGGPAAPRPPKSRPALPSATHAPISRNDLPPAKTAFEAWAENLDRKLREARARVPAAPAKAKPPRKPFVFPGDPADLARFKEILSRRAPESPASPFPAAPAPFGPSGAVRPAPPPAAPSDVAPLLPPSASVAPGSPAADLSRLPAPRPAAPARDSLPPLPAPPPFPGPEAGPAAPAGSPRGTAPESALPPPSPRGIPAPGQAPEAPLPAPGSRPRPSEMEWLDEEDDLAARLHSLLRRQARRRGVDLS